MGIECERKSIYKDIEVLMDYGMDIIKTRTPKNGFFLGTRPFETAEVRLLLDAVQSADFITKRKTGLLLEKIEAFVSNAEADKLKKQVYIDNRHKCSNEEIYYTIDALDTAIKNEKKVYLKYSRRRLNDKFAALKETKEFILSPYALVWSDDHYYLIANNEKYPDFMHLRLDRIRSATITEEPVRPFQEICEYKTYFDVADYASKKFNMFSGQSEMADLLCSKDILEEILDRFGENANLRKADDDHFILHSEMTANEGLASWIMQFGGKIKVLAPQSLAELVKNKAEEICRLYSGE